MSILMITNKKVHIYFIKVFLPLFGFSIAIGVVCGIVNGFYNWCAENLIASAKKLYSISRNDMKYFPIPLFSAIAIGFIIGVFIYFFPEIRTSGIPQIEGEALGKFNVTWYTSVFLLFIVSLLTIITGMSLGKEGPSIFIGGCIGLGISGIFPIGRMYKRLLVTVGTSTGLSISASLPLAGLIFAVEEIYKKFSAQITMATCFSACLGLFIKELIYGDIELDIGVIHYKFSPILFFLSFICGILGGLAGVAFNLALRYTQKMVNKWSRFPLWLRPVIPAAIGAFIAVYLPNAAFQGDEVISNLFVEKVPAWRIVVCFFVKFFFTCICFASSAAAGLFTPTLAVGALLGGCFANLFVVVGLNPYYMHYVQLVTISAFFVGLNRAAVTATIIFPEYSQHFSGFVGTLTASMFAYFISEFTRVPSFYDALVDDLVERMEQKNPHPPPDDLEEFAFVVDESSLMRGLNLNELELPQKTAVEGIVRHKIRRVPNKNMVLQRNDEIWFITDDDKVLDAEEELRPLF